MARRNAKAGAPAHIGHPSMGPSEDESSWQRIKREEWDNPEKKAGNIAIATSLGLFFSSIVAIRLFGDALAPA